MHKRRGAAYAARGVSATRGALRSEYRPLIHSNGLTRHKCLTCETRRRGYSTDSDCPRLAQSSTVAAANQSSFRCGGRDMSTDCD